MPEIYDKAADGNVIGFEWTTLKNAYASEQAGRPIFDKVLMFSIRSPGQKYSEVRYEAIREFSDGRIKKDAAIFAKYGPEIKRFLDVGENVEMAGTPLTEVPWVDSRLALELKLMGVHTIDMLAELSDSSLQKIGPGARALQEKAKAFLKMAADTAEATRYASENLDLRNQISDLQTQLSAMNTQLMAMSTGKASAMADAPQPVEAVFSEPPHGTTVPQGGLSAAMAASLGAFAESGNVIPDSPAPERPAKKRGRKSNAEKAAAQAASPKAA